MKENIFKGIKKVNIEDPLELLVEYKKQFYERFKNFLLLQVTSKLENNNKWWSFYCQSKNSEVSAEQKFVIRVCVIVPKLEYYRVPILKISYFRTKVYPCKLFNALRNRQRICKTPDKLKERIDDLFLSEDFKIVVGALLSQIDYYDDYDISHERGIIDNYSRYSLAWLMVNTIL